jgi:hypothetical protein
MPTVPQMSLNTISGCHKNSLIIKLPLRRPVEIATLEQIMKYANGGIKNYQSPLKLILPKM